MNVIPVRMLQTYGANVRGDVCGFRAPVAERLVAAGAAIYLEEREAPTGPTLPDPSSVDSDVVVHGLDDRDPHWRERAKAQRESPLDRMDRGDSSRRK